MLRNCNFLKVIESVWTPDNSISLYPGLMMDINEVKCSLPESPVNIGDYGNKGITAAGLKIAVSNNRINASKVSAVFITYDSVCQECNNTIKGCQLKTDACFISAHCFAQNQSHPNDWCQQCLPQISTKSWEKRRDNQSPKFTTSTVLHAFLGKELRVQLSAVDPENRTIRYTFAKNSTLGASLTETGFFNYTKNTNDSTIVIFNVTDECGAYSVLHALVVIKECPCQNSGECLPDYRYLDGAGNFTCSCPAGYTGTLCELDVNECALFKPCFNGSCNNEQPGFSCSCFAGYTGDLCQTEINECAPYPCFLGVPCTDLIASFSCGPCPGGYSGDGVNCTRMDGKVDECVKKPQVCHSNAKCMYNNGSYVCQCTDGYTGDGKNNCTDVDECIQTPDICHQNANCTNTEGSYSCQCLKGYTGDGKLNCSDTDECTSSPNISCIQNAQCSNTVGSYVCQCAVGYSGDGYSNCTDINECQQSYSVCHSLAKCSNTDGSFSCQCDSGFTGDGIVNCTDVDECSESPSVCHQHAKCTNTIGYFSCQCNQGFLGDGIQNCTENRPPQFAIPSAVYAILNNDFKIQIMAVDPENQDMTFTLLSNGTLTTAQISKQLLTIPNVKENGTVYVQVEDEMGAKNILILEVNAFECPCVHNGKCYQNKSITYPVQPSDYLCECEDPYTGQRCEIRPNPCEELPCYPGLNCSTAQNSEGFTCEECPTLFQGDGKQCELKANEEKSSVVSEMTLTDQKWDDQLETKTSKVYKNLASQLTVEIRKVYKDHAEFSYVIVKGFRRGSIIVEIELIFTKEVEDPLKPLMEIKEIGKLGKMRVKIKTMQGNIKKLIIG
ncbi:von Willebrand factor D and EGF domain-containing -like [Paramuricea clavata]|uniref:von Willebrand factor D and EGF domain-containing -like n=1 Tax=Paramuricea clavata TaxID=317549 RepID=A0A7D9L585_PARCT|nr:von Willebrand factor D and EGF domain-containing -like [Paramuricea clavata]